MNRKALSSLLYALLALTYGLLVGPAIFVAFVLVVLTCLTVVGLIVLRAVILVSWETLRDSEWWSSIRRKKP